MNMAVPLFLDMAPAVVPPTTGPISAATNVDPPSHAQSPRPPLRPTTMSNGITYRNYEAAVASIFSKYSAIAPDDCPLLHFPPKVSQLPPLPDDSTLSTINAGIPTAVPTDESHLSPITASSPDRSSAKCTRRLAKKRLAKKQRAEAERDGEEDQPPCWPFNVLPPAACPRSGGRLSGRRARKKEGQLSSMIRCVLAMLPDDAFGPHEDERRAGSDRIRIVDFAGGSGHLALPLALLLPKCEVVIVDLKERSLDVAKERAAVCGLLASASNLKTFRGSITEYNSPFDIGLALHACGEATDLVLRACGEAKAAFVTASCCVGKLQIAGLNPYVYQANNDNAPTVQYPQSRYYRNCLELSSDKFDALAKAADHAEDSSESVNSIKRVAKLFLETDRLSYAVETYGYDRKCILLTRMEPLDSSPKNDILLGWTTSGKLKSPYSETNDANMSIDPCVSETERQLSSLINAPDQAESKDKEESAEKTLRIDWTSEEEEVIRSKLQGVTLGSGTFRFPTGMGSRHRRLIHFVAEDMGLAHWGDGKKGKDKTVCVAQRPRESSTRS